MQRMLNLPRIFLGFSEKAGIVIPLICFCQLSFAQPTQLIDGGLFYFPPSESLLTIGGWGNPDWAQMKTVWSLTAAGWSAMPDVPAAITHTGADYDEANQRLIVMGGVFSDLATWTFDGKAWSKVAEPITSQAGYDPEIIYDSETKQLVLYFGTMGPGPLQDTITGTYILGANGWEKQSVSPEPGGALDVGFVYDRARKEGVWFNGSETWTWKNNSWTKKQPAASPAFDFGQFGVAYDAARQVVVVYGQGETWTWDGSNWTKRSPAQSPDNPKKGFFGFGYDAKRQVVVLWGGEMVISENPYTSGYPDDLWEWNGSTWSKSGETYVPQWMMH